MPQTLKPDREKAQYRALRLQEWLQQRQLSHPWNTAPAEKINCLCPSFCSRDLDVTRGSHGVLREDHGSLVWPHLGLHPCYCAHPMHLCAVKQAGSTSGFPLGLGGDGEFWEFFWLPKEGHRFFVSEDGWVSRCMTRGQLLFLPGLRTPPLCSLRG